MIGFITGNTIHLNAPTACVQTSSGIGYDIELPVPDFCQLQLGSQIDIWTHMVVREDAQLLYGFLTQQPRDVFRQLIKINGVGAKMALAMLSNLTVTELMQCIKNNDEAALVRIPGIGKKTAQRLLIELEDKLKNIQVDTDLFTDTTDSITNNSSNRFFIEETKAALISLGYKEKEANSAVDIALQTNLEYNNTQELLKASLKQLSK